MAKKNDNNTEGIIVQNIQISQLKRGTQDIKTWRDAITAAEKPDNPKRLQLYTLYAEMLLDAHLKAVYQKRKLAIQNTKIEFVRPGKEGIDESIELIIKRSWFIKMLGYIMDQVGWGHSLIEFIPNRIKPELAIGDVRLIERRNVIPEFGVVALKQGDTTGILYREPPVSNYVMEIGDTKDFGLFMEAAQYVIYKRGGFGDWAQFAELFGMPFRLGKYNPHDEQSRIKLNEALENAGSASHAVIPEGTSLEFLASGGVNNSSSNVYSGLIEMCNKELSKLFLGNTMTTEDGSSKSQAQVHAEVEYEINEADRQRVEFILNDQLIPILVDTFGLKQFADGYFKFDDSDDLDTQLDREIKLAGIIDIEPEYFSTKYNVPLSKSSKNPGGGSAKK